MAVTIKNLGKGSFSGTTDIAGSATKSVLIDNVIFSNAHVSAPSTLVVWIQRASPSVSVNIINESVTSGARKVLATSITLDPGDKLQGTSSASNVFFLASGMEKDL